MRRLLSIACIILASASGVGAEPDAAAIRRGKSATALVACGKAICGSAFCVEQTGFFYTSVATTRPAGGEPLSLVINSGEESERSLRATVIRVDPELGVALLKAEMTGDFVSLEPGDDAGLIETMQVVTFGYPNDDVLPARDGKHPNVNVNVARITAIRKSKGQPQFIQLDQQLNLGNCGGPVLDGKGAIIGMVCPPPKNASGTNLVIPVNQLQAFLARPHIVFTPPAVAYARRYEETSLPLRILSFGRARAAYGVEVTLSSGKDDQRKYAATAVGKGTFAAKIVPLPPRITPTTLPVVVDYSAGQVRCMIEDTQIRLDDRPLKLSQLVRIERQPGKVTVYGRDGRQVSGQHLEIGALKADFGGYMTEIDTFRAKSISIGAVRRESDRIQYTIAVRQDGKTVAETTGQIQLVGGDVEQPIDAPLPPKVPTTLPTTRNVQ